jgi:hypothetical protein
MRWNKCVAATNQSVKEPVVPGLDTLESKRGVQELDGQELESCHRSKSGPNRDKTTPQA